MHSDCNHGGEPAHGVFSLFSDLSSFFLPEPNFLDQENNNLFYIVERCGERNAWNQQGVQPQGNRTSPQSHRHSSGRGGEGRNQSVFQSCCTARTELCSACGTSSKHSVTRHRPTFLHSLVLETQGASDSRSHCKAAESASRFSYTKAALHQMMAA